MGPIASPRCGGPSSHDGRSAAWLGDAVARADGFQPGPLLKKIDALKPVSARSDLAAAVRFAATTDLEKLDNGVEPRRRIWVLTDGQLSDWNLGSKESFDAFCKELKQESGVEFNLALPTKSDAKTNVGLKPLVSDAWRKAPGERLAQLPVGRRRLGRRW